MNTIIRKIVQTNLAPAPIGPYSQAVLVNGILYISGQMGLDPKTQGFVPGGVEAQTRQALQNMGAILNAAGATHKNVVKCTVLLSDMANFAAVNNVYKEFFTSHYPARAACKVACLPKFQNGLVEIEAIAQLGDIQDISGTDDDNSNN